DRSAGALPSRPAMVLGAFRCAINTGTARPVVSLTAPGPRAIVAACERGCRCTAGRLTRAAANSCRARAALPVTGPSDLSTAFDVATHEHLEALIVLPGIIAITNRADVAQLALERQLPTIADRQGFTGDGVLMSYGANTKEAGRRAAYYVD